MEKRKISKITVGLIVLSCMLLLSLINMFFIISVQKTMISSLEREIQHKDNQIVNLVKELGYIKK